MNKSFKGLVLEVGERREFEKDGKISYFRTVLFELPDGKYLAANLWMDATPPEVGRMVRFTVDMFSERNKKTPSIFYHKVNLKDYEYIPTEVLYSQGCDSSTGLYY
jgi:hypothetical protein